MNIKLRSVITNTFQWIGLLSLILLGLSAQAATPSMKNCAADAKWFTHPAMPVEVKKSLNNGKDSSFCDFYQFSWQAFAYLMSPNSDDPSKRNFEVEANYPILKFNAQGKPGKSCDDKSVGNSYRISLSKSENLPEIANQAGDGATIYDQASNVVYYEVRFNRNLCNVSTINELTNFPAATTELKLAWQVVDEGDQSQYFTMKADIGKKKNLTLGLVGMHVVVATADHPEFIWATFEHQRNSPNCVDPLSLNDWSFASSDCAAKLAYGDKLDIIQCQFNSARKSTKVTGTPTEICREHPYGTGHFNLDGKLHRADKTHNGVNDDKSNFDAIVTLNKNVNVLLTGPMAIFKKYFNVGAIWLTDTMKSSTVDNQRGSLLLANTVAETTFQNVDLNPHPATGLFASNCFGCHHFSGPTTVKNKNTTSGKLSHIFFDIAAGAGQCLDIQAGPIWNNNDAKKKCRKTCQKTVKLANWHGQWHTTEPNIMSVCSCCP